MDNANYKFTLLLAEDDELQYKKYLKLFNQFDDIKIVNKEQICTADTILSSINNYLPDFLLLDIELEDCTAFDIIDKLPKSDNTWFILLVTSHDDKHIAEYAKVNNMNISNKNISFTTKDNFDEISELRQILNSMKQRVCYDLNRPVQLSARFKDKIELINYRYSDIAFIRFREANITELYFFNNLHKLECNRIYDHYDTIALQILKNKFFIEISSTIIINTFHIIKVMYQEPEKEIKKKYMVLMPGFNEPFEVTHNKSKLFKDRIGI